MKRTVLLAAVLALPETSCFQLGLAPTIAASRAHLAAAASRQQSVIARFMDKNEREGLRLWATHPERLEQESSPATAAGAPTHPFHLLAPFPTLPLVCTCAVRHLPWGRSRGAAQDSCWRLFAVVGWLSGSGRLDPRREQGHASRDGRKLGKEQLRWPRARRRDWRLREVPSDGRRDGRLRRNHPSCGDDVQLVITVQITAATVGTLVGARSPRSVSTCPPRWRARGHRPGSRGGAAAGGSPGAGGSSMAFG